MTLSQIECFLLVVEKSSFTEAAKTLYVSQPAISRRIGLLEEELGIQLFHRNNSQLILTPAGTRFYHLFHDFIDNYNKTLHELRHETPSITGSVRIGCADGWDIGPFLQVPQKQLQDSYPGISLSTHFHDHEVLMRKLVRKELDLIIEQPDLFTSMEGITVTPIRKAKCILMFSSKHPLAEETDLNLYAFRNFVFYMRSSESLTTLNHPIMDACISYGFQPKIEYLDSQSAVYAKMLSEDGVFLADEFIIESHNPLFRHIVLPIDRTIALVSSQDKTPAAAAVENTILKHCQETFYQM